MPQTELQNGSCQDADAAAGCFYQLSGYKHWLDCCPCDQCDLRRIELYSKIPISPSGVTVNDEQQNIMYVIYGLRANEYPVKGTYVDSRIVPGFKYTVRHLGKCADAVFTEAKRLLSIGQGYGKRLTFQSDGKGADHFWSDSCTDGFGLSLVALETGQEYTLHRGTGQQIGRLTITWVAPGVVEDSTWTLGPTVCARVGVAFKADVSLDTGDCGVHDYKDVLVSGFARMEKNKGIACVTVVEEVALLRLENLQLLPAEQTEQE